MTNTHPELGAKLDPLANQVLQPVPGVMLRLTIPSEENCTVYRVAWSPDGKELASLSKTTIYIHNADNGGLVRKIHGHLDTVVGVAWSPDGIKLASGSTDRTVRMWNVDDATQIHLLEGHQASITSVAWSPDGKTLASGSLDGTVRLWDADTGILLDTLYGESEHVYCVSWSPDGFTLAFGDQTDLQLWSAQSKIKIHKLHGHTDAVLSVAWSPERGGNRIASASRDKTVRIWDVEARQATNILEGHVGPVNAVLFSAGGLLLVSRDHGVSGTSVRLWRCDTWQQVAVIPEAASNTWFPNLAANPLEPQLATVGSNPETPVAFCDNLIHIWQTNYSSLIGEDVRSGDENSVDKRPVKSAETVLHTTAKIVLVGDSGVGKTGLGWRLAHGEFKEHASTHGQQFWIVDQLGGQRKDGTRCEAVLWDLAGQPDYRLIHALFLDDADLALVLFDPTDQRDPLGSAEYWIKQLPRECPKILVASRVDRGHVVLTNNELDNFCERHGIIGGWIETSAFTGLGLDELLGRMKEKIPWEKKTAVTTTSTFKRIKAFVLKLKQDRAGEQIVFTLEELREKLQLDGSHNRNAGSVDEIDREADMIENQTAPQAVKEHVQEIGTETWQFTDAEMLTAIERLATHGFVRILKLNNGQQRILLVPELLNNLASSFVLEARRNRRGLGALEESRLFDRGYRFPELEGLNEDDHALLLDATITAFLENRLSYRCFRESWGEMKLLVFPELMKLKKPERDDLKTEEGVSYVITGATENTFAGVVVLLGYTNAFLRTDQAQDVAYYEYETNQVCGVRQILEANGERTFVLFFNSEATNQARTVFEGLVEKILSQKKVQVRRLRPMRCSSCQTPIDRTVMSRRLKLGKTNVCCEECGKKLILPPNEALALPPIVRKVVELEQSVAELRTRFEEVAFEMLRWGQSQKGNPPTCFVSYAWGNSTHERWVEHRLATDLQKAGITVVLDRWENEPGSDLPGFVERIEQCDFVLVVGSPAYLRKHQNNDPQTGTVVAAEMSMINSRLIGTKSQKATVIPLLLEGTSNESLPPLLRPRISSDFRDDGKYFSSLFVLLLKLYHIGPRSITAQQWNKKLGGNALVDAVAGGEFEMEAISSDTRVIS